MNSKIISGKPTLIRQLINQNHPRLLNYKTADQSLGLEYLNISTAYFVIAVTIRLSLYLIFSRLTKLSLQKLNTAVFRFFDG